MPSRVGLQRSDDGFVEQLPAVALQPASAFGDDRRQATGAFAQLLGAGEPIADVVSAPRRQLGLEGDHIGVEGDQLSLQPGLLVGRSNAGLGQGGQLGAQGGDLPPGDVDAQSTELGGQLTMSLGRLGLAFEGPQLAADLAEQVLQSQEVRFGGVEAALRLLFALAVLEDAGGLLDDRPALFRASVEYGVDLALADDDVLLAADPGIGQQLLDIEQAARHVVDGVFAVAAAEQRALDGDLGELDRQDAGGVVDRQADLGAAERRAARRSGEDHVVHLLAAHRRRRLGAEHPGDGIDDVRFARAVGADDDRDARLELEGRGLGEGLEAFEGQRSEEHGGPEATGWATGVGG